MKKWIAVAAALALVLPLSSCGVPSDEDAETKAGTESEETAVESAETESAPAEDTITFEETTVIENDQCKVTIQEIDDALFGYELKTLLENKSAEITYMYTLDYATVNGVDCGGLFSEEVAPQKKSNADITLNMGELEENGITKVTDIALAFQVYDTNDWLADKVVEEVIHIYPYGEEQAEKFVRPDADGDLVLVDNNQVTITVTGYEKDDIRGYGVKLYLVNKTDTTAMFSVSDASVNGFTMDSLFATSAAPGCSAFTTIYFSNSDLEEAGISSVNNIDFTCRAYDDADWEKDNYCNVAFSLNPPTVE